MAARKTAPVAPPRRAAKRAAPAAARRLSPEERSRQIVREAVRWFSEAGFGGNTRELARRLGITQPLLYRYFPSKADLIDRVYEEVFLTRWKPEWETLLDDDARPLEARLLAFYLDYAQAMLQPDWIRILMFSGLHGSNVVTRLLGRLRERVFTRVIRAVRAAEGAPIDPRSFTEGEYELVWALHASIFYLGVRQWVYGLPIHEPTEHLVERAVKSFLHGAPAVMRADRATGVRTGASGSITVRPGGLRML